MLSRILVFVILVLVEVRVDCVFFRVLVSLVFFRMVRWLLVEIFWFLLEGVVEIRFVIGVVIWICLVVIMVDCILSWNRVVKV